MSPQEITPDSRPRRHRDSAYRPVADDGGLVVLPWKAEVKVLNPVGTKVFSLLDGEHTVREIVRLVTEEFDITQDDAMRDVTQFLTELNDEGMLDEAPEPAS